MKKDWLQKIVISAGFAVLALMGTGAATTQQVQAKTSNVSDSKQQLVDIVLRPKSQKSLHKFVYNSVDPTSSSYRKICNIIDVFQAVRSKFKTGSCASIISEKAPLEDDNIQGKLGDGGSRFH